MVLHQAAHRSVARGTAGQTRRNERGPWGAVVFICSLHANVVIGEPHYGISKAAVAQLTRELAWKFGPNGIRVNSISPGWIRTARNRDSKVQQEKFRHLQPRIPLQKPGYPVDVAKVRFPCCATSGRDMSPGRTSRWTEDSRSQAGPPT